MSKVTFEISSEKEDMSIEFVFEGGKELLNNARNRPDEMEQKVLEAISVDIMIEKPETYRAKIVKVEE